MNSSFIHKVSSNYQCKVSGSSPDGVHEKKENRNSARSLGNMEGKRGENEVGKLRIGEKKRAM